MPVFKLPPERCLYDDQMPAPPRYPALQEDGRAQICVIGGGYTGIMTALHLARAGHNVILIEAEHIGYGASGRNSGQLIPGFQRDIRKLAKNYGDNTAVAAFAATIDALTHIRAAIDTQQIDCEFRPGLSITAANEKSLKDLEHYAAHLSSHHNHKVTISERAATARALGSDQYEGALVDVLAGRFNPLKYLRAIAGIAASEGVIIHENTRAFALRPSPAGVEVVTPLGTILADKIVLAGDAYQGWLMPRLRRHQVVLKTSMLATDILSPENFLRTIPSHYASYEWRGLSSYFAKTGDGRLIFGGGDAPLSAGKGAAKAFANMRRRMLEIFPYLEGVAITHWWGGHFSVTNNQTPDIGGLDDRLYYAFGYAGHGVVATHMAARIIADMIMGGSPPEFTLTLKSGRIPGAGFADDMLVRTAIAAMRVKDRLGF